MWNYGLGLDIRLNTHRRVFLQLGCQEILYLSQYCRQQRSTSDPITTVGEATRAVAAVPLTEGESHPTSSGEDQAYATHEGIM